uniref:Uncharacterized protein n=1 Tax=Populus davidiana TaxID=266767 RepID=A0A6M2EGZ0_9ROSI
MSYGTNIPMGQSMQFMCMLPYSGTGFDCFMLVVTFFIIPSMIHRSLTPVERLCNAWYSLSECHLVFLDKSSQACANDPRNVKNWIGSATKNMIAFWFQH